MKDEDIFEEINEHLSVLGGNLGICCQEYCDAPNAIYSMEKIMDLLEKLKDKRKKWGYYEDDSDF